jgi:hypothetical protein
LKKRVVRFEVLEPRNRIFPIGGFKFLTVSETGYEINVRVRIG